MASKVRLSVFVSANASQSAGCDKSNDSCDAWGDIKILFSPSEAKISSKEIENLVIPCHSERSEESQKNLILNKVKYLKNHNRDSSFRTSCFTQNDNVGRDSSLVALPKNDNKNIAESSAESIMQDALWGGQSARNAHIEAYLQLLRDSPHSELAKIFGTKRIDLDMLEACLNLTNTPRIEALRLYNGVAYKALDFAGLEAEAQDFLRGSVLIFSNLFGAVLGNDLLPYYHLNQNFRAPNFSLQSLYKAQRAEIDALLSSAEIIIDLRAGVYAKAYPLKSARFARPHFILPLPKGTSHNAKLCRGEALKELAKSAICGRNELIKTLGEKFILVE